MTPTLTHIADFLVEVGAPIAIGETAQGLRRVVPITGGTIQGVRLSGAILNTGADFLLIGRDGFTQLEARYVARLDDGTLLYVENRGSASALRKRWRASPAASRSIRPRFISEAHRASKLLNRRING